MPRGALQAGHRRGWARFACDPVNALRVVDSINGSASRVVPAVTDKQHRQAWLRPVAGFAARPWGAGRLLYLRTLSFACGSWGFRSVAELSRGGVGPFHQVARALGDGEGLAHVTDEASTARSRVGSLVQLSCRAGWGSSAHDSQPQRCGWPSGLARVCLEQPRMSSATLRHCFGVSPRRTSGDQPGPGPPRGTERLREYRRASRTVLCVAMELSPLLSDSRAPLTCGNAGDLFSLGGIDHPLRTRVVFRLAA
jgi:hypothetical protein